MLLIIIKPTRFQIQKTYYNFIDDFIINKHNTIYTNGGINVTKTNKIVSVNDSSYFTKTIEHTNDTTNKHET